MGAHRPMGTPEGITDLERLLLNIVSRTTYRLGHFTGPKPDHPHWVAVEDVRALKRGDVVIGVTGMLRGGDRFVLAKVEQPFDNGDLLLRAVGSQQTCRVTNEMFYRLGGIGVEATLDGPELALYVKVLKAFKRGGEPWYTYGGIEFPEPGKARVWVRPRYEDSGIHQHKRFPSDLAWDKRTTIGDILGALKAAGYGTAFESRSDAAPTVAPSSERRGS